MHPNNNITIKKKEKRASVKKAKMPLRWVVMVCVGGVWGVGAGVVCVVWWYAYVIIKVGVERLK